MKRVLTLYLYVPDDSSDWGKGVTLWYLWLTYKKQMFQLAEN
jgi:hypothetical protein